MPRREREREREGGRERERERGRERGRERERERKGSTPLLLTWRKKEKEFISNITSQRASNQGGAWAPVKAASGSFADFVLYRRGLSVQPPMDQC